MKAIYVHVLVIVLGILAYTFADVDSKNGFFSLLLPAYLIFSIIYLVTLVILIIHKARNPVRQGDNVGLLTEAVQELGKGKNTNINLEAVLSRTAERPQQTTINRVIEPVVTVKPQAIELPPSDDEDDINLEAWENDDNWTGPDWFAVYFSKQDSRSWVSKRIPLLGWTPNLGQSLGFFSWLLLWTMVTVLLVVIL